MLQGGRFGQGVAVLPHLQLAVELMEEDLGKGEGGRARAGDSWGRHCAVPQFPLLALWQTLPTGSHLAMGTVTLCPPHLPAGPAAVAQPWSGSAGIKTELDTTNEPNVSPRGRAWGGSGHLQAVPMSLDTVP